MRKTILKTVLRFDGARAGVPEDVKWLQDAQEKDERNAERLNAAKARLYAVEIDDDMLELCARLAADFAAAGHRGDYVMALAARAAAAREDAPKVTRRHVADVARMALQHRRPATVEGGNLDWGEADEAIVTGLVGV